MNTIEYIKGLTAYQLADFLEHEITDNDWRYSSDVCTMLRQQQAEINQLNQMIIARDKIIAALEER
jgi:hypothetical protein